MEFHFKLMVRLIYSSTVLIFLFVSCSKDEIDIQLPEGWEDIPGQYDGWISYLNPSKCTYSGGIAASPSPGCITKQFALNSSITKIDGSYHIRFEQNDNIQIPTLILEPKDVNDFGIYFELKENSFFKQHPDRGFTRLFIHADKTYSLLLKLIPNGGDGSVVIQYNAEKVW